MNDSIAIATKNPTVSHATLSLTPADLLRSVYLIGKTGTGKSTLLEHLFLNALDAGFGGCLIDPHGDLAASVLGHLAPRYWNQVVVVRPADVDRPVGLNILGSATAGQRGLIASGVIEVFRTLWGPLFGPRSEHLLRNAVLAILQTPAPTLVGLVRFLVDADYRCRVLPRVTDPVVRLFWMREFPSLGKQFTAEVTAPVLNKLGGMSTLAVRRFVGQAAPRVNLREVIDHGRILVVDLSGLGRDAAQLVGAIIVTGLDTAAHARAGTSTAKRRPYIVAADEFQNYVTGSFMSLLAEGRKFGMCAALAHQHLAQLEDDVRAAVIGNVGTIAAFTLGSEDAKLLAPEFAPELSAEDLIRLRRHHLALRLLKSGEAQRPVICRTIPPPVDAKTVPEVLLRICAERYGRDSSVVDREIAEAIGVAIPPQ